MFYGWKMQRDVWGAHPLYRGMVVEVHSNAGTFDHRSAPTLMRDGNAAPQTVIVSIAKLKCLKYLVRTFGVRNSLTTLLKGGPAAYRTRSRNFCRNWSVPAMHAQRCIAMYVYPSNRPSNEVFAITRFLGKCDKRVEGLRRYVDDQK